MRQGPRCRAAIGVRFMTVLRVIGGRRICHANTNRALPTPCKGLNGRGAKRLGDLPNRHRQA